MVSYVLDENLIDFGSALEEQDYDRCSVAQTDLQCSSVCCTSFGLVLSRVPYGATVHSSLLL